MIPRGMSVQEAYRLYRSGNLLVNRKYQRKLVWPEQEKAELIDTILRGYPIPLILLAERPSIHGPGRYEILDGVQRLNAIFSFIENHYPVNDKYFDVNEFTRAKQLSDEGVFSVAEEDKPRLDERECANILDYQLAVTTFSAFGDEEVTEVFGRINSRGRQLSDQERRQAGVINIFGELVRKISAEIRGDASKEILLLSQMPEISIETSRTKQHYGLRAEDMFWYKQGILTATQLRSSEDEEMVADILSSIILNRPFKRSKDRFDQLYDENSDLYREIEDALFAYPPNKLYEEVKQTFSVLREIVEEYDDRSNALRSIVNPGSTNPIKTSFYSIFMAFYQLLVEKDLSPTNSKGIMESLRGLQSEMTASQKYTLPEDRKRNIDKTVGLIQEYFAHKEPSVLGHGPGLAIDFVNALRRSRIETPRYEFKQGLLELSPDRKFNGNLVDRIINTACAIANLGPNSEGYIYLGVADSESDANKIKELDGMKYTEIAEHYIVGIDRECRYLGIELGRYLDMIIGRIRCSELTDPLKTQILTQIDIISYKTYTVIRFRIPPQSEMSFVGDRTFVREGNQTVEVKGQKLLSITKLFSKSGDE